MTTRIPTPETSASRPVNNAVTASVAADWTPGSEPATQPPFAIAVDDESHLMQLAQLTSTTLDALRTLYQDSRIGLARE